MVEDGAFSHKIDFVKFFWEILNPEGQQNRKNYGDFAEWVDFAYWWSFIGEGSAINGATPSSLTRTRQGSPIDNRPLLTPLLGKIPPFGLRHFTSPYLLNKTGNLNLFSSI